MTPLITPADRIFVAAYQPLGDGCWRQRLMHAHYGFQYQAPGFGGLRSMDRQNALISAELKRRGIAAIEQALQHGPVHLLKCNRSAAVVLSEQHYRQLPALQWLMTLPPSSTPRSKAEIDAELGAERDW